MIQVNRLRRIFRLPQVPLLIINTLYFATILTYGAIQVKLIVIVYL